MAGRETSGDGVSTGKKHLPLVEPEAAPAPVAEADQLCRCGVRRGDHFQVISEIAFSPFNTPKIKYLLGCPGATFEEAKP